MKNRKNLLLSLVLMIGILFIANVNASSVNVEFERVDTYIRSFNRYTVSGTGTLSIEDIESMAHKNGYELLEIDEIYITGDVSIYEGDFIAPIMLLGSLKIMGGNIFSIDAWNEFEGKLEIDGGTIESITLQNIIFDDNKVQLKGGKITNYFYIGYPERLDFSDTINKIVPYGYKMTPCAWIESIDDEYYSYEFETEINIEKMPSIDKNEPDKNEPDENEPVENEPEEEKIKEENKNEESKIEENNNISNVEKEAVKELKATKGIETIINVEKELPAGSVLDIKEVTISKELQKTEKNLKKLYDINVLNENAEIVKVSDNKMKITITLDENLKGYKAYEVVYVKDGKVEERIPAIVKDGKLTFETSHLSEYGIIAYNTVKTGDNIILYVAILTISLIGSALVISRKVRQ